MIYQSIKSENIQRIIARAQTGDHEAFEAIYRHFCGDVFTMAMYKVYLPEIAEDVTQEVFISVFNDIHQFKYQSTFSTWLQSITSRRITDYFRKNKKHYVNAIPIIPETESEKQINATVDPSPSPLQTAIESETRDLMAEMIGTLNPIHSDILYLRYLKMMSYQEISKVLQCRMGTVKSRLKRAHNQLDEKVRIILS